MKKFLTIFKYIFFLALGVTLLYFAFRNTNPQQLLGEMKEANYFWVGMSVLGGIVSYYYRAARWLVLLEPLGYKPKISNSVYSVFFGYFANIAAPRIGELARCSALNQTEKIPLNTLIGTVILERVIDVVVLLVLMISVFIFNIELFGDFFLSIFQNRFTSLNSGAAVKILLPAIAVILLISSLIFLFRKKILQIPFMGKIKIFLLGVIDGFSTIGKMKKKWTFVWHTFLIWMSYVFMTYLGFFALKETVHLSFIDSIFITVAGGIGMAVPAQGGIGTYHASIMLAMVALGVTQTGGLVFATIMHASQMFFVMVAGSFSFAMLYVEKNKNIRR